MTEESYKQYKKTKEIALKMFETARMLCISEEELDKVTIAGENGMVKSLFPKIVDRLYKYNNVIQTFREMGWNDTGAKAFGYESVSWLACCLFDSAINGTFNEYAESRIKAYYPSVSELELEKTRKTFELTIRLSYFNQSSFLEQVSWLRDRDELRRKVEENDAKEKEYREKVAEYNVIVEEYNKKKNEFNSRKDRANKEYVKYNDILERSGIRETIEEFNEAYEKKQEAEKKYDRAKTQQSSENECWDRDSPHFRKWCVDEYYNKYLEAQKEYNQYHQKLTKLEDKLKGDIDKFVASQEELKIISAEMPEVERELQGMEKEMDKREEELKKMKANNDMESLLGKAEKFLLKSEEFTNKKQVAPGEVNENLDQILTKLDDGKKDDGLDEKSKEKLEEYIVRLREALEIQEGIALNAVEEDVEPDINIVRPPWLSEGVEFNLGQDIKDDEL